MKAFNGMRGDDYAKLVNLCKKYGAGMIIMTLGTIVEDYYQKDLEVQEKEIDRALRNKLSTEEVIEETLRRH